MSNTSTRVDPVFKPGQWYRFNYSYLKDKIVYGKAESVHSTSKVLITSEGFWGTESRKKDGYQFQYIKELVEINVTDKELQDLLPTSHPQNLKRNAGIQGQNIGSVVISSTNYTGGNHQWFPQDQRFMPIVDPRSSHTFVNNLKDSNIDRKIYPKSVNENITIPYDSKPYKVVVLPMDNIQ